MSLSLKQQEVRLAYFLLLPSFLMVFIIIIIPVLLNVWISFKPLQLSELRPASISISQQVKKRPSLAGETLQVRFVFRNTSTAQHVEGVNISIPIPKGLNLQEIPESFIQEIQEGQDQSNLHASFDVWEASKRREFLLNFTVDQAFLDSPLSRGKQILRPSVSGKAKNPVFSVNLSFENYINVMRDKNFFSSLWITVAFSTSAALSALILGLLAALLVNRLSRARGMVTTLLLFPYIAPIIAVTYSWVSFLDPFSGTINHLLLKIGWIQEGLSFFSMEFLPVGNVSVPLAFLSVVGFSAWRYFPLMFLFILARLQAIPSSLYEAARVDGAGILHIFSRITMPLLMPVLTTLFLIRFMWNFNKFDDIFLLTGGAAGTRTLPIEIYTQAFGRGNIGGGAAVSMFLFLFLALFLLAYTRYKPDAEDL